MIRIAAAKLPGFQWPIIGVRSVGYDHLLIGTMLRGAMEVPCRLTPDEAEEAIRQIAQERREMNEESRSKVEPPGKWIAEPSKPIKGTIHHGGSPYSKHDDDDQE